VTQAQQDPTANRGSNGSARSRIKDKQGAVRVFSLDDRGRPIKIIAANSTVCDLKWQSSTDVILSALSPDGSLKVATHLDLAAGTAEPRRYLASSTNG
jgi:hypothetical protein